MIRPNFSLIIINFNTAQLTIDCLQSILKFEKPETLEFIVVDNASKPEDLAQLEKDLIGIPQAKLVKSKCNLGFAAGNMLGFQHASGKWLAFINSDVLFTQSVLEKMENFMFEHPKAGILGPQILDDEGNKSTSFRPFEGLRYLCLGKSFLAKTQPNKPNMKKQYSEAVQVDFVIGSFMFFRKSAFEAIGGFDINTFLYYEETDVCVRSQRLGYETWFLPNLEYIHLEGKSSNQNLNLKMEHLISYFYILRKNFGYWRYVIAVAFVTLSYGLKAAFKKKNRFVFSRMISLRFGLSHSMRHTIKIQSKEND